MMLSEENVDAADNLGHILQFLHLNFLVLLSSNV